ncbi:inositol monophosphatase 1-like [Paramacrobiotus metropolitanus]|uniref:inositol monophosphatase 1-like n=1 Tax=Paramacrobiotus metropolitanus TaxID=2943436 RepID=UPI002445FDD2|nr:inositol monophosphatase 1-like [Paramacrobiotus metropolitanus]
MVVTGDMAEIQSWALFAEFVAKEAGETIRTAMKAEKNITLKSSVVDLVTETDKAVEAFIIDSLKGRYPDHKFIGEESDAAGQKAELTDAPTWIIDPIDGTTNFVHSFPYVSVSVGLAVQKELVAGIIYHVMADEMYTAIKGGGAFCNGNAIKVSQATEMAGSLVVTEVGSGRDPSRMDAFYKNLEAVLGTNAHGIRAMGSAALNMCMIARGSGDVCYEYGIHCWDMAAGYVIIREAGGFCCDPTGGSFNMMARRVIGGATESICKQLSGILTHIELEHDGRASAS